MKLRRSMLLLPGALVLAASAGYGLRVYAEGAPTAKPIFYAGTLESGGMLAKGPHTIVLTLYDAEMAGKALCTSETPNAPVEGGRFRVEVSADCVAKMREQPDVWAGLKFTGPDGVPHELPVRSKVGAVPYAMEAQHAVSANSALTAATAVNAMEAQHAASATTSGEAQHASRSTSADGLLPAAGFNSALKLNFGTFTVSNGSVSRATPGELSWGYGQIPSDAIVIGVANLAGLRPGCYVEAKMNAANSADGNRVLIAIRGFSNQQCADVDVLSFSYIYLRP